VQADPAALEAALGAAQRGDVAAFNVLVRAYQRQVYNVCYRTLGATEDAADASQDAFLSAYRGLHGFRGSTAAFRAWLLRIAVNACYDQLRRKQRRPAASLDVMLDEADEAATPAERLPDPDPGPEEQALGAETLRRVETALAHLPAEQRLAVVLCDVQGLSYEDAAQAMSVELGTVKSRLSRARARLRDLLTASGELSASAERLEVEDRQPS
jgi:RNA polymerase sigma-70 factor (ECF subfamily)